MRGALFVAALILLFPAAMFADAHRTKLPSSLLYTPDRRLMKVIACGHGPTLADLVWVQSTNYIMGEFKAGKTHIEHLYALYDVMTELDPDFVDAYVTGAVFLSSVAEEPELSLQLLEKGQGRLDEKNGEFFEVPPAGRAHPANKQRWRILDEYAATYLVSFAGFAPTLEERYHEINIAGRLYTFGANRYPRDRYPERPKHWEETGHDLAFRKTTGSHEAWNVAAQTVWFQRIYFTPPSSPLYPLYKRRYDEVESRGRFEKIERTLEAWKVAHPGGKPGDLSDTQHDPLGVGYFIVDGQAIAPALDAAVIERELQHEVALYRRSRGRAPVSLAEVRELARERGDTLREVPRWVHVTFDPKTAEVRTEGVPPLAGPPEHR